MGAPRWTPEVAAAVYKRAAKGETAAAIAVDYGCTRNAVIGLIYRHSAANGLPRVSLLRGVARRPPPTPPKPRPPAAQAAAKPTSLTVPKKRGRLAISMSSRTLTPRQIPTCDGVLSDGSTCGREILRDGKCLGHLFIRGDLRLRDPARRITSHAQVALEVQKALPVRVDKSGRVLRMPVGKLSAAQVTQEVCHGVGKRLAAEMGWEQVDEHTYQQRRAA